MLSRTPNRLPSRHVSRLLLLLALVAASLALTQCQLVGDKLTGVDVGIFKRKNECLAQCQADFQARNQAEDKLHQQNLAACNGDQACIDAENARHEAAERDSKLQRDACFDGCHNQGDGTTGP